MHLPRSGRRMNKTAIAFGTFDGVHRGHQEIINAMLTAAEGRGLDPLIYTFSNHPAGLFGKSFSMIMTDGERIAALKGFAPVAAERLDRQFAATEPEDFVRHMAENTAWAQPSRASTIPSAAGGRGTWIRSAALGGNTALRYTRYPR